MPDLKIDLNKIREKIGAALFYNNKACQFIDLLEDGPSIVIQFLETDIQKNQHGNATRRVPETLCIPILSSNKSEFSDLFLSLNLIN